MSSAKPHVNAGPLDELYSRPGFLLRRAHQIAVGIFVQECATVGLTPPQHGVLIAVANSPGLSQAELAGRLGFDRATVGQMVEGLESRGLLRRKSSAADRRHKSLALTPKGARLMKRASGAIQRTSERLLQPFSKGERALFMELLARLTTDLNQESRTPLRRKPPR
ncbi:MAG: MarR family winged helix-turn-helix transcriptional regulator [Burkholderiales bacterium]